MRSYVLTAKEHALACRYCNGVDLSDSEMAMIRVLVRRVRLAKPRITSDMKLGISLLMKYYKENGE